MAKVFWEQIRETLPANGKLLSGDLNITGSVGITGSLYYNGQELSDFVENVTTSGIFTDQGTYYSTTNDIQIKGNTQIELQNDQDKFEVLDNNQDDIVTVQNNGAVRLGIQSTPPQAIQGGIYYDISDEFFLGFND